MIQPCAINCAIIKSSRHICPFYVITSIFSNNLVTANLSNHSRDSSPIRKHSYFRAEMGKRLNNNSPSKCKFSKIMRIHSSKPRAQTNALRAKMQPIGFGDFVIERDDEHEQLFSSRSHHRSKHRRSLSGYVRSPVERAA